MRLDLKIAVAAAREELAATGCLTEERARNKTPQGLCMALKIRYPDGSPPVGKQEKHKALISWASTRNRIVLKNEWLEAKSTKPKTGHCGASVNDRRLLSSAAAQASIRKKKSEPQSFANSNSDKFLSGYEWRQVRMMALKKYGATCQCCGASPATGAVMNVDHIKPRKLFPELALDLTNLQILCSPCNHGKGNWDQTDWRGLKHPSVHQSG